MVGKLKRRYVFGAAVAVASLGMAFAAGMALAAQPHMTAALSALQTARSELQAADPDKAGHRVKALEAVNHAIDQVNMGLAAGS